MRATFALMLTLIIASSRSHAVEVEMELVHDPMPEFDENVQEEPGVRMVTLTAEDISTVIAYRDESMHQTFRVNGDIASTVLVTDRVTGYDAKDTANATSSFSIVDEGEWKGKYIVLYLGPKGKEVTFKQVDDGSFRPHKNQGRMIVRPKK